MKVSVIFTTILVAQVSASMFDVFQGAVLSVQNGFGKLLSDVVTDVKDTVDCTILAVEHVLSLSEEATTRYYDKCGRETNKTDSVNDTRQDASLPKVELTLNLPNNEDYIKKELPAEIDAKINETLFKVLGNNKPHDNVPSIEKVLAKESDQLADVSVLIKRELEKLSNVVNTDLRKMEKHGDSEASMDTILQEVKVLEKREHSSKNISEANEIHQVVNEVLGKLDAIEATESTANIKLEEIMKDLESNSNNTLVGLRRQFEEWKKEELKHLIDIKSKIEEHDKILDYPGSHNRQIFNHTQPNKSVFNTQINEDNMNNNKSHNISSEKNTHGKETLNNSMNSITIENTNDTSLISTANEHSSLQKTYSDNGLNYTVITSASYSSIESSLESVVIHHHQASGELTTLLTNKSRNDENNTVQGDIPATDILPSEQNQEVSIETDSRKDESSDLAAITNAAVTSAPERTGAEMTTINVDSFMNENTSTITNIGIENATVNASNSEDQSDTTPATFKDIISSETVASSTQFTLKVTSPVTETILPIDSNTTPVKDDFFTVTSKIGSDNDSNNTILSSTSPPNIESTSISDNGLPEQNDVTFGKSQSTSMAAGTSLPIIVSAPEREAIEPEESSLTTSDSKESSTITTKIMNNDYSNHEIVETTSSTSSSVENAPESETIEPEENTSVNKENSIEDITESTTNSIIEDDGEITITSTAIPFIQTSEGETNQAEDTTLSASEEEYLSSNETQNTTDDDDDSDEDIEDDDDDENAMVTSKPETSLESISEEDTLSSENEDPSSTTSSSPSNSLADSNYIITSTPVMTTDSEIIESIESTTQAEKDEPSMLSTTPTVPDAVENENTDSNDTLASSMDNPDQEKLTDVIQTVETNNASEEQETSITATQAESIPTNKIVANGAITSRNDVDFRKPPILKANTLRTAETLDSPDLNSIVRSPPFSFTRPVHRESLTPSKLNQQNYNVNGAPRNNFDNNSPLSLRRRLLQTRQRQSNPDVPMFGQAEMPPITRGLFNDGPKWLTPDRPVPNFPNRHPQIQNNRLQKTAFDHFDSVNDRLSHSDSPFGPEKQIFRDFPSIKNAPRRRVDPPNTYSENLSYVSLSKQHMHPPFIFDTAPENNERQLGLTTSRPESLPARANDNKNPSFDYDSFFHRRDSEAHQHALREARQLMANSKRSDRIINNIMKNKNKYNARSIFR